MSETNNSDVSIIIGIDETNEEDVELRCLDLIKATKSFIFDKQLSISLNAGENILFLSGQKLNTDIFCNETIAKILILSFESLNEENYLSKIVILYGIFANLMNYDVSRTYFVDNYAIHLLFMNGLKLNDPLILKECLRGILSLMFYQKSHLFIDSIAILIENIQNIINNSLNSELLNQTIILLKYIFNNFNDLFTQYFIDSLKTCNFHIINDCLAILQDEDSCYTLRQNNLGLQNLFELIIFLINKNKHNNIFEYKIFHKIFINILQFQLKIELLFEENCLIIEIISDIITLIINTENQLLLYENLLLINNNNNFNIKNIFNYYINFLEETLLYNNTNNSLLIFNFIDFLIKLFPNNYFNEIINNKKNKIQYIYNKLIQNIDFEKEIYLFPNFVTKINEIS